VFGQYFGLFISAAGETIRRLKPPELRRLTTPLHRVIRGAETRTVLPGWRGLTQTKRGYAARPRLSKAAAGRFPIVIGCLPTSRPLEGGGRELGLAVAGYRKGVD
jgi:hypothetical protein